MKLLRDNDRCCEGSAFCSCRKKRLLQERLQLTGCLIVASDRIVLQMIWTQAHSIWSLIE